MSAKRYHQRYLNKQIINDLKKKMVFVGGPRQVGKTTVARHLLGDHQDGYLNWDTASGREKILKQQFPDSPLWVFDEIHKYQNWRNYLKGLSDEFGNHQFGRYQEILVTGSARLDCYRRGGDSLQGRYHYLRLNPLSVAELKLKTQSELEQLLRLSGFPEPYYSGSETEAKRWALEYRTRVLQEDLASLENVKDLSKLELLMMRLPEVVGSPLSINALREDLQVSHRALANWVDIFSRLYAIFLVPPFGAPSIRAVKKEQKHYHYDWSLPKQKGAAFENMVAVHILKWVQFEYDTKGRELELRYFRDIDRREVDFIITEGGVPVQAIECKWNDDDVNSALKYFKKKFPGVKAYQISMQGKKDYISKEGIQVCPALKYLSQLI